AVMSRSAANSALIGPGADYTLADMRAQLIRTAVLEIYEEVRREGARADQALRSVLRREKLLRSVERRAVSDAVYGLLRLQGRVDHLLQRALGTRKLALDKLATPTQHLPPSA